MNFIKQFSYIRNLNDSHNVNKKKGPTETRTRIAGFKVQSADHYTIGPTLVIIV